MAKTEAKLEFLRMLMEEKHILFGSFSDTLTKNDKMSAWKKMHERAQALALVPENKDFTYTRDTLWQNMKKVAMKKRDNSRATGTGGTNFTKVDHAIFDIIGKDTPNMDGLPVSESMSTVEENMNPPQASSSSQISTQKIPINKENENLKKKSLIKAKTLNKKEELQLKKLNLTVKLLKKENYLKKLKIMQMEHTLNIQPETRNYDSSEEEIEYVEEYLESD